MAINSWALRTTKKKQYYLGVNTLQIIQSNSTCYIECIKYY